MTLPELLNQLKVKKETPLLKEIEIIGDELLEQTSYEEDTCADILQDFLQFHEVTNMLHCFEFGIILGILLERTKGR